MTFVTLTFKRMVRTGLEHSFLPGASLWSAPDAFIRAVPALWRMILSAVKNLLSGCAAFLKSSERAQQQWSSSGVSGHSNRSHDCQLFQARLEFPEWSRRMWFTKNRSQRKCVPFSAVSGGKR